MDEYTIKSEFGSYMNTKMYIKSMIKSLSIFSKILKCVHSNIKIDWNKKYNLTITMFLEQIHVVHVSSNEPLAKITNIARVNA